MPATLSVCLITRNEAGNIEDCIRSVEDLADEILVLDSGSTDDTVERALQCGARVATDADWRGFGVQRHRVQALARGDWILMLDADERVTPALASEIRDALRRDDRTCAYALPRLSWCFGRFIRHGGWYPDYVTRLYPRERGRYDDVLVHEKVRLDPGVRIERLRGDLLHFTYANLRHYLEKSAHYAEAWAEQRARRGIRSSIRQGVIHAAGCFARMYLLRLGLLDGRAGLLLALLSAHSTFAKYADLWIRHQPPRPSGPERQREIASDTRTTTRITPADPIDTPPRPMRICVLGRVADRSERALLKGLARRGHEVTYIAESRDPALEDLRQAGVHVQTEVFGHKFDRAAAERLRETFAKQDFDLAYASGSRPLTTGLLAARGTALPFATYRGTLGRVSYLNPIDRFAQLNPRVRRIIVNSTAIREVLVGCRVPAEKIAVVYKGHALDWYADARPIRREDHGIPPDRYLVGCVANFRSDKDGVTLLEALALIPRELPIHLALVGEIRDPAIPRAISRLDLHDRVTTPGYRRDALDWTTSFDLAVMPSKRESFSRAIVEAIAVGTPVLVTAVGGMCDLVEDGRTGITVMPSNPPALAAAIVDAYHNPGRMRAYADAGREHLRDRFSVERYVRTMERVFSELLPADGSRQPGAALRQAPSQVRDPA